jgi:hypothetical protein
MNKNATINNCLHVTSSGALILGSVTLEIAPSIKLFEKSVSIKAT